MSEEWSGRAVEGVSSGFSVRLTLTAAEQLEIFLENRTTFEIYSLTVKQEDLRRQAADRSCNLIESAVEVLRILHDLVSKRPFDTVVVVDARGKLSLKLDIELSFGVLPAKRRSVLLEFQTTLQSSSSVDRLRTQLGHLATEKAQFEKQMLRRVEQLEEENQRLRRQLEALGYREHFLRHATDRTALVEREGTLLQTRNALNVVLLGDPLTSHPAMEWRVAVPVKTLLVFGAATADLVKLQGATAEQEIGRQKLLIKESFSGGEILSCSFEEGEIKYTIEKGEVEEEEGERPEFSYNLRRGSFMCKHVPNLDRYYPCFALHFAARIELLTFGAKK